MGATWHALAPKCFKANYSSHSFVASSTTTVEIQRTPTKALLMKFKGRTGASDNDAALKKALEMALSEGMEGEIYIDILFIGNQYAKASSLEVIFQVGTNPPRYYKYSKGKIEELAELPTIVIKQGGEQTE